MKNKNVTKIYDGLTYIVVVCGSLISFSFINLNMGYISKLLIFMVYMSPTIQNIYFLKTIKIPKGKIKLINMKKCILEITLMILGISISIYIFIINKNMFYISIPLMLASVELFLLQLINLSCFNQRPLIEYKINLKNVISPDELKKYYKWEGFFSSIIGSILFDIIIIILLTSPFSYFGILGFNIYSFLISLFVCSVLFLCQTPFQQILDCKYNSFVKYQGICIDYSQGGKGSGGSYTIKISDDNLEVSIKSNTPRLIFRPNQKVTVIFGARSKQVIGFW